jgi:AcrR family transcriptional regulator
MTTAERGDPPEATAKTLGRPRDVDSAETRNALLEGARRIFARDGYEATTNRSIAAEVGITTGAIYHYFPSKAELYAAVYAQVQDVVYDRFEEAVLEKGTLTERFGRALRAAVDLNRDDSSLAGFVVTVSTESQRHPELFDLLSSMRSRSAAFINRLVADAAANGEFAEGVEPKAVEDLLSAVMSGLAIFSSVTGDPERHAAAIRALQRFLDGELLKRPRSSR